MFSALDGAIYLPISPYHIAWLASGVGIERRLSLLQNQVFPATKKWIDGEKKMKPKTLGRDCTVFHGRKICSLASKGVYDLAK